MALLSQLLPYNYLTYRYYIIILSIFHLHLHFIISREEHCFFTLYVAAVNFQFCIAQTPVSIHIFTFVQVELFLCVVLFCVPHLF